MEMEMIRMYLKSIFRLTESSGDLAQISELPDSQTDVYAQDGHGKTPMSWAANNGHSKVVKLLLEKGAEVDAKDKEWGNTPISRAANNGHSKEVKLLLEKGAEVDAKDNEGGHTRISRAANNGHSKVVKLLLEKGAEVD